LGGFRVRLKLNDGFTGLVDLSGQLTGPVFHHRTMSSNSAGSRVWVTR
jgi:hypothetical protein